MERKGVVGAGERSPWHRVDEPLADYIDVFCAFGNGLIMTTCKIGGEFIIGGNGALGPVLYWMHIPPLPKE